MDKKSLKKEMLEELQGYERETASFEFEACWKALGRCDESVIAIEASVLEHEMDFVNPFLIAEAILDARYYRGRNARWIAQNALLRGR